MKFPSCVCILLFCASSIFAQLPSGALIHLSGDAGIADSAGKVKEWSDAANPKMKFFAPLAANQPSHSGTLNGHHVLTFDGVGNYLEGPPVFPVNEDYTLCVVAKVTNYALADNIISG